MNDYFFTSRWEIKAPIEKVWEAIYHSERWPDWWKGVESVAQLKPGNEKGIGARRRFTWKSQLPYRLTFEMETTRVEKPLLLEARASGELEGKGTWHLQPQGPFTLICYDWNVRTAKPWMNFLAPIARPLFRWNHDVIMRWGEVGLQQILER